MSVTVVTCIFNGAQFLDRYIASLLELINELEAVIIVDDGSTDATGAYLSKLDHPKITVMSKENSGLPNSRNYGLQFVNSESVLFLDVDDTLEPTGLIAAKQQLNMGVNAVVGGVRYVNESGAQTTYLKFLSWLKARSYRFLSNPSQKIFYNNFVVTPGAALLRTELVKKILFDERLSLGEDWEFFSRYFSVGAISILNINLINYMVVQSSMSEATLTDSIRIELLKDRLVNNFCKSFEYGEKDYKKHLEVVFALFSQKRLGYPMSFCRTVFFYFHLLIKSPRSSFYIGTSVLKYVLSKVTACYERS